MLIVGENSMNDSHPNVHRASRGQPAHYNPLQIPRASRPNAGDIVVTRERGSR